MACSANYSPDSNLEETASCVSNTESQESNRLISENSLDRSHQLLETETLELVPRGQRYQVASRHLHARLGAVPRTPIFSNSESETDCDSATRVQSQLSQGNQTSTTPGSVDRSTATTEQQQNSQPRLEISRTNEPWLSLIHI